MGIAEVISAVGRFAVGRKDQEACAPEGLSPKAQEIWGVCDRWGQRVFNECKFGRLIADPYLSNLLVAGFQSTALWYEFHEEGDSFGQGKPVLGR